MTAQQNDDLETKQIPENELEDYFTKFTKHFLLRDTTSRVDLEVISTDLGDQFAANDVRILGITYEPKDKALEFELEAGDHRVFTPSQVWVTEEADGFIRSIEVVRGDGTRSIAKVKRGAVVLASRAQSSSADANRENRT
jgi:hypothetical protein